MGARSRWTCPSLTTRGGWHDGRRDSDVWTATVSCWHTEQKHTVVAGRIPSLQILFTCHDKIFVVLGLLERFGMLNLCRDWKHLHR